jgi:carbon-monoxide dehydrogenase medium subunit
MLLSHGEDALALAGGTAVVLLLRQRLLSARYLVDLAGLAGLRGISWDPRAGARIGALATLREVERSPELRRALPLLSETYRTVGNVRVRNAATVGGNLAHGDYRLDPPATLLVLGARVGISRRDGEREVPMAAFFRGFEETVLERGELITGLTVPPPPERSGGAYVKYSSLAANDWPCVGAAALAALEPGGRIETLRLAVTAVNPVPLLIEDGAGARGRLADAGLVREIAAQAAGRVAPIQDIRGSEWYKRQVTAAITREALERAFSRALTALGGGA